MLNLLIHKKYMQEAIDIAKSSRIDVPVGAVIVHNDEIIAKAVNLKEKINDSTAHAEMLVIKEASQKLQSWRLENTALYVTLEPCPMCAAAILYSRIPKIYFGAYDPMYGALGSAIDMRNIMNYNPEIVGGIQEESCSNLLKDFFSTKR